MTLALLFWPVAMMMSPMAFDAPGSLNSQPLVIGLLVFLAYPVWLFLLLGLLGGRYFGVNSFYFAIASVAVVWGGLSFLGYGSLIKNLYLGVPNTGYGVTGQGAYYNGHVINGADLTTFKTLGQQSPHAASRQYAVDAKHFYFRGEAVPGVSVVNLQPREIAGDLYWLNDRQVVYENQIIPGANPVTFAAYPHFGSWFNSQLLGTFTVYYQQSPIARVDVASFRPLSETVAKDKKAIYYGDRVILPQADPLSFALINDTPFARDSRHPYFIAYNEAMRIEGADPNTYKALGRDYYRASGVIFHADIGDMRRVLMADADTFVVTDYDPKSQSDAKDKHHHYLRGVATK
ncbi:DKNYY domain-containing protein [Gallaecimonas mangrovi]|uniref:DKNYY domain-containing protein n=1 Tax=Gallaecimonas mangrovi TaxID=2291597 RepID=UPI0012601BF5|nr:DKNYY domain-containing protein [Gallaecimonas mangrovi]